MQHVSFFTLLLFFFWLLPLGAFIDPSKEDKTCGGARAICLCSHALKGKKAHPAKGLVVQQGQAQKEAASRGGASNYFLTVHKILDTPSRSSALSLAEKNSYFLLITRTIEHVPKA